MLFKMAFDKLRSFEDAGEQVGVDEAAGGGLPKRSARCSASVRDGWECQSAWNTAKKDPRRPVSWVTCEEDCERRRAGKGRRNW